jgi:hypothetical protein
MFQRVDLPGNLIFISDEVGHGDIAMCAPTIAISAALYTVYIRIQIICAVEYDFFV